MAVTRTLTARKSRSAAEEAYEALLHSILNLELRPGDVVSEAGIAEQLDLSRTPVREAVKRLETEGLITVVPRKGSIVALLDHQEVQDGSELRAHIECRALERAFRFGVSAAELEALNAMCRDLRKAWQSRDLTGWVEGDVAFHDYLVSLGRSVWSKRFIQMINMQLQRARYWTSDRTKVEETLVEHEAIVESIAAGDLESARERLRTHILKLPERVAGGRFDVFDAFKNP